MGAALHVCGTSSRTSDQNKEINNAWVSRCGSARRSIGKKLSRLSQRAASECCGWEFSIRPGCRCEWGGEIRSSWVDMDTQMGHTLASSHSVCTTLYSGDIICPFWLKNNERFPSRTVEFNPNARKENTDAHSTKDNKDILQCRECNCIQRPTETHMSVQSLKWLLHKCGKRNIHDFKGVLLPVI
jgi:hypothetical protein